MDKEKVTEQQINCDKHNFRRGTHNMFICQKCGVDIVDLIDALYEKLDSKTKQFHGRELVLREALELIVKHEYIIPPSLIVKVQEALKEVANNEPKKSRL